MNQEIIFHDRENANTVMKDEQSRPDEVEDVLKRNNSDNEAESLIDVAIDNAEATNDDELVESDQEIESSYIDEPGNMQILTKYQTETEATSYQANDDDQAADVGDQAADVGEVAPTAVKVQETAAMKVKEIESKLISESEVIEKLTVYQNKANRMISSAAVVDHAADCARETDEAQAAEYEQPIESKFDISEPRNIEIMTNETKNEHLVDYPQDITTRFGLEHDQVSQDDIQNLKVTLVPIQSSFQSRRIEEKTAPIQRPQSPVCDFIQRVILESYV